MECLNNAFKINGRRRKSKKKFISFFDFKRFLLEINISLIELILCVEIIRCERANSRDSKLVSQRARARLNCERAERFGRCRLSGVWITERLFITYYLLTLAQTP